MAEKIGARLRGGETLELVSDLGAGKTTFVRGLARGMGSNDQVRSPSFTLSNEYRSKTVTMYHFDFYRLSEPGIMRDELAEALSDPMAVVVVEWGDIVEDVLPQKRLRVHIKSTGTVENQRKMEFKYPQQLTYLLENI